MPTHTRTEIQTNKKMRVHSRTRIYTIYTPCYFSLECQIKPGTNMEMLCNNKLLTRSHIQNANILSITKTKISVIACICLHKASISTQKCVTNNVMCSSGTPTCIVSETHKFTQIIVSVFNRYFGIS